MRTTSPCSPCSASAPRPARIRLLPAAGAILLLAGTLHGQGETGFLRGQGHVDVVLSYTLDQYDEFWVDNKRMSPAGVGEVKRSGYVLYAAYGVTDDIDVILSGAYLESKSDGTGGAPDESDLQDVVLAGKWRVLRKDWSWGEAWLGLVPGIKLPITDYEDNAITALGDGQVDLRGRIVGHVQTNQGLFASLETGYDRRNGAPDDEIPIHLTVGGTVAERVTITSFLSHTESLGGTNIGPMNYFPANEEDFTRAGLGAYVRITDHLGVTGTVRTTLDGRNTGDVNGLSFGVVLTL